MKTTVVPAQVTTVEDKIAGNLGFSQLLLLTAPVFIDGGLFVVLPPLFKLTTLKLVSGIIVALLCLLLAVRIKGKILLTWILVIARYNLRPSLYIFNKNDTHLRAVNLDAPRAEINQAKPIIPSLKLAPKPLIPMPEMVRLESAVADPRAKFHIKAGKGGLRVYIREVKEENL